MEILIIIDTIQLWNIFDKWVDSPLKEKYATSEANQGQTQHSPCIPASPVPANMACVQNYLPQFLGRFFPASASGQTEVQLTNLNFYIEKNMDSAQTPWTSWTSLSQVESSSSVIMIIFRCCLWRWHSKPSDTWPRWPRLPPKNSGQFLWKLGDIHLGKL
jgi:hypothetical protein